MTIATLPNFGQRITARCRPSLDHEMIVDNFAGAGGASLGIEAALGRAVDVAINHSKLALETHGINHPATRHLCGNIWDYEPLAVTGGRDVGLMWASPDCKHFSKAKGGKPVSPRVRGLAWVVTRWARDVGPRVIILENVQEFTTWGPLTSDLMPCPKRKGATFRRWVSQLERYGYEVQHRVLCAADYGVPTTRRRLFLIARNDGQPIVWPEATHAPREKAKALGLLPWRSAAECIDWSLACPSIFERKRPLADATLRRIANGIKRYVIDAAEPYIVTCNHGGTHAPRSVNDPMRTLTASRDAHGLCVPYTVGAGGPGYSGRPKPVDQPFNTLITENHTALVSPAIVQVQNASNDFGCHDPARPFPTITAMPKGGGHALSSATLIQTGYGEREGQAPRVPHLDKPLGTVVSGACKHALVSAFLAKHYGGVVGHDVHRPIGTVTAVDHHSVVASHLTKFYGTSEAGADIGEPMPTVTAGGGGGHMAEVRAFLVSYYGSSTGAQSIKQPTPTVTTRDRLGLVTVEGQEYAIADIGLRMLVPRELLRAQFGRFAADFVLIGTQAQQVAGIGNSVPPEMAERLVAANVKLRRITRKETA